MYITVKLFYILVGLLLGAKAIPTSDSPKDEKTSSLDIMKKLEERVYSLEDELEKRNNESEVLKEKLNMMENFDNTVNNLEMYLNTIKQQVNNSKARISGLEKQLEYGGKKYQTLQYMSKYL